MGGGGAVLIAVDLVRHFKKAKMAWVGKGR